MLAILGSKCLQDHTFDLILKKPEDLKTNLASVAVHYVLFIAPIRYRFCNLRVKMRMKMIQVLRCEILHHKDFPFQFLNNFSN